MLVPFVDLKAQYETIRVEIDAAIHAVLNDACFILGPPLEAFERDFADFCGVEHCVGVASGTDALHLALRGMGIGPGDEVIVPAFTFVATVLAVTLAGATPVLVDVRRDDALLDARQIAEAVTPRTKALLPVHLHGRCADMRSIQAIADEYGLKVVEDAAQAHGARYHGRPAGSLGQAAAFSFYPSKNLGAYGDGGAITTNDDALAERLRLLRNWGSRQKHHHEEWGLNSRLDTLQAAVLGVKLRHLADWNEQRRRHAKTYDLALAGRDDLVRPAECEGCESVFHLYVVRTPDRDEVCKRLHRRGVQAGIHYPCPVHRLPAYEQLASGGRAFPQAEGWAAECLSLPMYPELTDEQIRYVARQLG